VESQIQQTFSAPGLSDANEKKSFFFNLQLESKLERLESMILNLMEKFPVPQQETGSRTGSATGLDSNV
jgi:hypothetical protein